MDLKYVDSNKYLISMTSAQRLAEAGLVMGLNEKSTVLDLCCGYGEMLKIWAEHFNISGVGVDACSEYITTGAQRLSERRLEKNIRLIKDDAANYSTDIKFDAACMCGVGDLFGGIEGHISMLEQYIKPDGKIVIAEGFLKRKSVPKELTDFEGTLYTLNEMRKIFADRGWYISYITTGTDSEWERYISWDARRTIEKIRKNPDDKNAKQWLDTWYQMYFEYRREYEGWGFFVLERIE